MIGRSQLADLMVADPSVAPHHAELVLTDDGRHYLTDCATDAGTWTQTGGGGADPPDEWIPLRQGFVRADQSLRLGAFVCTLEGLLRASPEAAPQPATGLGDGWDGQGPRRQRPRGRVERDPATGEIVRRRVRP